GLRLARAPALGAAGREVEMEAGRRGAVEREAGVDPIEREVRGDADDAFRRARHRELSTLEIRSRRSLLARSADRAWPIRIRRPSLPEGVDEHDEPGTILEEH